MGLVDKSDNVEELRGLQKEINGINAEIRDIEGMVEALPKDDPDQRTAAVTGKIPGVVVASSVTPPKNAKPMRKAWNTGKHSSSTLHEELLSLLNSATTKAH